MARQNITHDPAKKEFEAYMDFSGGYNSEVSNEKLKDNEFPVFLNIDNSGRGSARKRTGRSVVQTNIISGTSQGLFYFYRLNAPEPDLVAAIGGRLYIKPYTAGTFSELIIKDGAADFTFQNTLPVEAVQYGNDLYIATGTKLVELTYEVATTTWKAKVTTPYTPTVMEAIYIGTNGLADNPDAYIQDGTSPTSDVTVVGLKPKYRTGFINTPLDFTTFINKPSGFAGTVDYKYEYKQTTSSTWLQSKDFTTGLKTNQFTFDTSARYDIKVTVRKTGDTVTKDYVLSGFTVTPVQDRVADRPVDSIQRCRKIMLHWDRILLCGDDKYPYQMYISDLLNPRYFPVSNTINFDFGKQEPITALVRFQDMLVIFTTTTIQTLVGKSVEDYRRYQIHDGIGCIAGWSAKVVGNNVLFLSDDGIMSLRPNPYRMETMNVVRIDRQIMREIPKDRNACAVVTDNQYWLCFPDRKIIYRFMYEIGVWSKDASDGLDIVQFLQSGDDVYNLLKNGKVWKHDDNVYTDAGVPYNMEFETKYLDLSASFNQKKLKRLFILARHYTTHNIDLKVMVYADSAIVLTPIDGRAEVENGYVVWKEVIKPNMHFYAGTTFGTWILGESAFGELVSSVQRASIRGKCRRIKMRIVVSSDEACELFGFGIEFKLKKV